MLDKGFSDHREVRIPFYISVSIFKYKSVDTSYLKTPVTHNTDIPLCFPQRAVNNILLSLLQPNEREDRKSP